MSAKKTRRPTRSPSGWPCRLAQERCRFTSARASEAANAARLHRNRFTDNASWHAVAEYRFWVIPRGFALTDTIRIERVGMALFYEVGTVADSLGALPAARIHTSYGVGLRFSLERAAVFRADVGFSREDVNVTVGFGLSF